MREIKFRGQIRKRGEKVNMKGENIPGRWVYGGVNKFYGERSIIYSIEDGKCSVYSDTVCQYTGLKDKNGKEIYEGDIFELGYIVTYVDSTDDANLGLNCGWYQQRDDFESYAQLEVGEEYEILGNIYENPELLKGE